MHIQRISLQPDRGTPYSSLLALALKRGSFERLDVAVAYAATGGAREFLRLVGARPVLRTRWLIGIDWCRSDPPALDLLLNQPRASVRIHDGDFVVARRGCVPRTPFHPKTWLFRGKRDLGVVIGSGNLSISGMTRGYEQGILHLLLSPLTPHELRQRRAFLAIGTWFDEAWKVATPYSRLRDSYTSRYAKAAVPIDDDASDNTTVPAERFRQLRSARNLWIEVGKLSKNRGPNRPGNQLDMSPMSRVFFGFSAAVVPRNTVLGSVRFRFHGASVDNNMRFGNNQMDKLNLPIPGTEGPTRYDGTTLLFSRYVDDHGQMLFDLEIRKQAGSWRKSSATAGTLYTMTGGRQWGVF